MPHDVVVAVRKKEALQRQQRRRGDRPTIRSAISVRASERADVDPRGIRRRDQLQAAA